MTWAHLCKVAPDWLRPYLDVPENAAPPLAVTPPHPDATGSHGAAAIEWIEREQAITLRWWQRLAIVLQLQHRADLSLCRRTMLESGPRRIGKSVRIRGVALWRMAHPTLIGEVQTIVHCGNDLPICREIQRGAWRWAEAQGWTVTKANGKEAVEAHDGSRWLVRSQDGVYGWDAGLAVVDEAWDVKPGTVSEGLEPAMLERCWAQLHIASTAHRRATSLVPTKLRKALDMEDHKTQLLLFAAPPGADPGDPAAWRAASPHWSQDRADMIAEKYETALAGGVDPQADDPDPMAGFTSQYLNVWRLDKASVQRGDPVTDAQAWARLTNPVSEDMPPEAIAVEAWFDAGVSVARAWRTDFGLLVSVTDHESLTAAALDVKAAGCPAAAMVGASLERDPVWRKHSVRVKPANATAAVAVAQLARLLADGGFSHDGGDHLTGQVLALRTTPGSDGIRMASKGRADAVKAAVWAAQAVRKPSAGRMRIVLPRHAAS